MASSPSGRRSGRVKAYNERNPKNRQLAIKRTGFDAGEIFKKLWFPISDSTRFMRKAVRGAYRTQYSF